MGTRNSLVTAFGFPNTSSAATFMVRNQPLLFYLLHLHCFLTEGTLFRTGKQVLKASLLF
jgi:hypothetical protein